MTLATAVSEMTANSATLVAATAMATSIVRGGAIAPPLALLPARRRKEIPRNTNKLDIKLKQLHQLWYQIPDPIRFFASGTLGTMCFFAIERAVHNHIRQIESPPPFVDAHQDSISFFLGYILQMGSQHLLHAWLVYGLHTINTREKYFNTLLGQSSAYFTGMIGSTFLNTILRKHGVSKDMAFFITLYLFAIINYFVVGWVVRRAVAKADEHQLELLSKGKNKRNPLRMRGGATQTIDGGDLLCGHLPSGDRSTMRSFILSVSNPVPISKATNLTIGNLKSSKALAYQS